MEIKYIQLKSLANTTLGEKFNLFVSPSDLSIKLWIMISLNGKNIL